MESKFKIGDKVRFNSEWGSYRFEDSLTKGEVVEVSDITDCGSIYVKKYVEAHVTDDEIELVEQDKKTAFLTELKELLIKYDAEIFAYQSDFEEVTLALNIGDDAIEYGYGKDDNSIKITPSNIFDYDKV